MYQSKLSGYYWAVVVAVGGYIGRYDWEARAMGRGLHVTPDTPLRWPKRTNVDSCQSILEYILESCIGLGA